MNQSFVIIVAFSMFLIQIGIMISNYREMVTFEDVLTNTMQSQLRISGDMQTAVNITQGIIIASVKANANSTEERRSQVKSLMDELKIISGDQHVILKVLGGPEYTFKTRYHPSPLLPSR